MFAFLFQPDLPSHCLSLRTFAGAAAALGFDLDGLGQLRVTTAQGAQWTLFEKDGWVCASAGGDEVHHVVRLTAGDPAEGLADFLGI